jgi:hypothetical protein
MEKEKKEGINADVIQIVLEEFSQDMKTNTQAVNDLITAVNSTNNRLDDIKALQEKSAVGNNAQVTLPANVQAKFDTISKGVTDIRILMGERPQPQVVKKQFLLFPEYDAGRFYKIVFGRWFLMLVILFCLSCLYQWAIHYTDSRNEIQLEQLQNDHIRKSWQHLYDSSNKEGKRQMDKVYNQNAG